MYRVVSQLWDEERKFWIDQTEGRAVLSHRLVFAFCLRSLTWGVLFRLVIIDTFWMCASMQQNNPKSYIYWIFLLYYTYIELVQCKSHIRAQAIKSKVSSQTPCCWGYYSEECDLKDKTFESWHKLEKILQWKVRREHTPKRWRQRGEWVWFLADGFTSRQSK